MRVAVVVFALLGALAVGLLTWLTLGALPAAGVALVFLLLALAGLKASRSTLPSLLALVVIVALVGGGLVGAGALAVVGALRGTAGPVATPDPGALASLEDKLGGLGGGGPFALELTEAELGAVVAQGLAANPSAPVRAVSLDLRAADGTLPGRLGFVATFKSGSLQATGEVVPRLEGGHVVLDVLSVSFGALQLPGLANGAVAALLDQVAALDAALTALGAEVTALEVRDDVLAVSGTVATGAAPTSQSLLDAVAEAASGAAVPPAPAEVYGHGAVDATSAPGSPVVLAVGDSLAANIGVASPREGAVSRFHTRVQARDGAAYGLENLGTVGASSASLLADGQLERAARVAAERGAAYVLVSVGANDLLPHLGSPDCADTVTAPACRQRVADATAAYRTNLAMVLDRLRAAAPDARVVALTPYNPFDLGFGSQVEIDTTAAVQAFNAAAAEVAAQHGALVADGHGALAGHVATVTHMLDTVPDIHPTSGGYDLLTGALLAALG